MWQGASTQTCQDSASHNDTSLSGAMSYLMQLAAAEGISDECYMSTFLSDRKPPLLPGGNTEAPPVIPKATTIPFQNAAADTSPSLPGFNGDVSAAVPSTEGAPPSPSNPMADRVGVGAPVNGTGSSEAAPPTGSTGSNSLGSTSSKAAEAVVDNASPPARDDSIRDVAVSGTEQPQNDLAVIVAVSLVVAQLEGGSPLSTLQAEKMRTILASTSGAICHTRSVHRYIRPCRLCDLSQESVSTT